MERFLNKKYKTYKHENLDDLLQEMGRVDFFFKLKKVQTKDFILDEKNIRNEFNYAKARINNHNYSGTEETFDD